jgi:hypothetical protein
MAPCDCGEHGWHITSYRTGTRATPQPVAPAASAALKRIAELDLLYQATMADLAMLHREHQGAKEDLAYWMKRAEEPPPAVVPNTAPWTPNPGEKISEFCLRTHAQLCHICDNLDCGNNISEEATARHQRRNG